MLHKNAIFMTLKLCPREPGAWAPVAEPPGLWWSWRPRGSSTKRDGVRLLALAARHWCSRPGLPDTGGVDRRVDEAARQALFCWAVHALPCAMASGSWRVPASGGAVKLAAEAGGSSPAGDR